MRTVDRGIRTRARRGAGPRTLAALLALVLAVAWAPVRADAPAPEPAAVTLGPGSVLWIEGTSTLHDYESRTTEVSLVLLRDVSTPDPRDAMELDRWLRSGVLRGLELGVPLAAMRSGKPALDRNMLKALRASEHPEIRFRLTRSSVTTAAADTVSVTADGVLRVAGHERPIRVDGHLVRTEAGVWLEGNQLLRMSEFEVKPPTMMMGTLRVHDPVAVHFRLLLVPGPAASGSRAVSR